MKRCAWVHGKNQTYVDYHDKEWGVPEFDEKALFEKLLLDGAQAGLSWEIILNKKPGYEKNFYRFDPEQMARMSEQDVERVLQDPGIVRNRLKVESFISNAQAFLELKNEGVNFSELLWQFVEGQPIVNSYQKMSELPTSTKESDAMAWYLKKCGFRFVGTTICYAFMQAVGMFNDHTIDCFCHPNHGMI